MPDDSRERLVREAFNHYLASHTYSSDEFQRKVMGLRDMCLDHVRDARSDPASVLAALLAESPEATVSAIEALLTTDEAVDGLVWESPYGLQRHTARRMLGRACRSLLSKAPKEDRDA